MVFHRFIFLAFCLAVASCQTATSNASPARDDGVVGFAAVNPAGATTGGAGVSNVSCVARDLASLQACLATMHSKALAEQPFTLFIEGHINGATQADGSGYTKAEIKRSNVSLIGRVHRDEMPTLHAVWVIAKGEQNLIIRNLRFVPGRDHELQTPEEGCALADTDYCDWNAEPDALTVQGTSGVWIDHCEFTDGPDYQGINPHKSHYKGYDGLLDIKRGANYVTVSYSVFSNHDKSILVGHSDKHDSDNFHVTFYRNHFKYLGQRVPRVRYGKVHLVNNWYENHKKRDATEKYYMTYTIGLGLRSDIYSEANVFDVPGATPTSLLAVDDFSKWGQHFSDHGSVLNNQPVDLNAAARANINAREAALQQGLPFLGAATWKPAAQYRYELLRDAQAVRNRIKAHAGVGQIEL